jgi:hypothetical protein
LLGVLVGGLITLTTIELQALHARTARREDELARLREMGAATLGPIGNLLTDSDPSRIALNFGPHTDAAMTELREQWVPLRNSLSTLGVSHPDAAVAAASERLGVAVSNSLTSTGWLARDMAEDPSQRLGYIETARSGHALARELLQIVSNGIRGTLTANELNAAVARSEEDAKARESQLP